MPILWALADPKTGEREVLTAMLDVEPHLAASRPGLNLITGKGFAGRETEASLTAGASRCCAPRAKTSRPGTAKPCSNPSASSSNQSTTPSRANSTSKSTAAGPFEGVAIRVAQRILAMAAAIWHNNNNTGQPVTRSLIAYDHWPASADVPSCPRQESSHKAKPPLPGWPGHPRHQCVRVMPPRAYPIT
jgi:hypothetical protein